MAAYTTKVDFDESYEILFTTFASGRTKDLRWRKWQLKQLWWLLDESQSKIMEALKQDLHRSSFEATMADISGVKSDVMLNLEKFETWAQGEVPDAGFFFGTLGKAKLRKEPLGVAFIMSAWNFPFYVQFSPLVACIAAGNCALLKPSELAPATQELIKELVPKYMDNSAIRVVTGGPQETSLMLEKKFNHIFYTGSNTVGRIIAKAAAKHLTPVVLELGGQAPAIICKTADVDLAAKRIAHAKLSNVGQICLNVNHIIADPAIHDQFLERLVHWNQQFLAHGNESFARIINERHFDRIMGLLKGTKGDVVYGGDSDRATKWINPTIIKDIQPSDSLLSEEIFGPLAPVLRGDIDTAISTINSMPHPLGLYIFSRDQKEIDHILDNTASGGVTINDVMLHAAVPNAPFGGVGDSGYGSYHGKYGFDAFSHTRTVVAPPTWMERFLSFRYAPFDIKNAKYLEVKNKLGFKPGETLEDQKTDTGGLGLGSIATKAAIAIAGLAVVDSATGGKLLFVHTIGDVVKKLKWN